MPRGALIRVGSNEDQLRGRAVLDAALSVNQNMVSLRNRVDEQEFGADEAAVVGHAGPEPRQ